MAHTQVVLRTRLIERLGERVRFSVCHKPERMTKESRVDKEIALRKALATKLPESGDCRT